jgi:type IV pilus assembly protein PilO
MELKMPATQRDQLLAFGAILAIAAMGLYYQFVWAPKSVVLAGVQARIDTLSAQNEVAQLEVTRGTASKLKDEAEQYGRLLLVMRTLVPVANEVPALINQLSTAARRAGLELGGIAAPTIINGDVFDTYKYKLSAAGSYHKLSQFLTNVGSLSRIMAPMNVTLSPSAPGARRQGPGEQILDVSFEVQTYVAKASSRAP